MLEGGGAGVAEGSMAEELRKAEVGGVEGAEEGEEGARVKGIEGRGGKVEGREVVRVGAKREGVSVTSIERVVKGIKRSLSSTTRLRLRLLLDGSTPTLLVVVPLNDVMVGVGIGGVAGRDVKGVGLKGVAGRDVEGEGISGADVITRVVEGTRETVSVETIAGKKR